jgi:hypothetical protein
MARGDRLVNEEVNGMYDFPLKIPAGLRVLAKIYQDNRLMPSLNAALIELLETHPAIAEIAGQVYNGGTTQ